MIEFVLALMEKLAQEIEIRIKFQEENVDLKEEIYELKRKIELQEIMLQEEDAERRIR